MSKARRITLIILYGIATPLYVYMCYLQIIKICRLPEKSPDMPNTWLYFALLIGWIILCVISLIRIVELIINKKEVMAVHIEKYMVAFRDNKGAKRIEDVTLNSYPVFFTARTIIIDGKYYEITDVIDDVDAQTGFYRVTVWLDNRV